MSRESETYAASMIRRFRESKPTSRQERETVRDDMQQQMWWVDEGMTAKDGNKRYEIPSSSQGVEGSYDFVNPRKSTPAPSKQPTKHSDVLSELRASDRESPFASTIDDMIAREIQELEREINNDPRRNLGGSVEINIRNSVDSFQLSDSYPTSKPLNPYSSVPRDPLADMRRSGDYFRSSIETLGSTGFKSLLYPELKLDGHDIRNKTDMALDTAEFKKADGSEYTAIDIHASMKEMLKTLGKEAIEGAQGSEAATTIAGITSKLELDMRGILLSLNEKQILEEKNEKERRERDEEMREEGRVEARSRQFLEFDEIEDRAEQQWGSEVHSLGGPQLSVPAGKYVGVISIGGGGTAGGGGVAGVAAKSRATPAAVMGDLLAEHPHRRSLTPHALVLNAVDAEVKDAEELFKHMKKLKTDLKQRMLYIDELADGRKPKSVLPHEARATSFQPTFPYARTTGEPSPWMLHPLQQGLEHRPSSERQQMYQSYQEGMRGSYDDIDYSIELKHGSLANTAKGIELDLTVAMNTLNLRLAGKEEAIKAVVDNAIWNATGNVVDKLTGPAVKPAASSEKPPVVPAVASPALISNPSPILTSAPTSTPAQASTSSSASSTGFNPEVQILPGAKPSDPLPFDIKTSEALEKKFAELESVKLNKEFDAVLGRESMDKRGFLQFMPPTLAEALALRDRSRDTAVPIYARGSLHNPNEDFYKLPMAPLSSLPEALPFSGTHDPSGRNISRSQPSAPPSFYLNQVPAVQSVGLNVEIGQRQAFGQRDEFQYARYDRPVEGQALNSLRSQQQSLTAQHLENSYVSGFTTGQSIERLTSTGESNASSSNNHVVSVPPTFNSIKERKDFLKSMKALRCNLAVH